MSKSGLFRTFYVLRKSVDIVKDGRPQWLQRNEGKKKENAPFFQRGVGVERLWGWQTNKTAWQQKRTPYTNSAVLLIAFQRCFFEKTSCYRSPAWFLFSLSADEAQKPQKLSRTKTELFSSSFVGVNYSCRWSPFKITLLLQFQ